MKKELAQPTMVRVVIKVQETMRVAKSPDMPGLTVAAREMATVLKRLPEAIQEMLGADGATYVVFPMGTGLTGFHTYAAVPVSIAKKEVDRVMAAA